MFMRAEKTLVKKIQNLLKKAGMPSAVDAAGLVPLTGGGSDRAFFRLQAGGTSLIVMAGAAARYDLHTYVDVGTFLFQHGIGVPRIIAVDVDEHIVLLEDLGDDSLYALATRAATAEEQTGYYRKVLAGLAEMQVKTAADLASCSYLRGRSFGYEAFRWETDYFTECFLKRFCGFAIENDEELDREFHVLAETLSREPRYFMHRDFQSQNIYVKDGAVRYIDFQTATKGLLQYDAVSLLKDAYVVLEDRQREELLDFYLDMLIGRVEACHWIEMPLSGPSISPACSEICRRSAPLPTSPWTRERQPSARISPPRSPILRSAAGDDGIPAAARACGEGRGNDSCKNTQHEILNKSKASGSKQFKAG